VVMYPLFDMEDVALFAVFDGHVGKAASLAAIDVVPLQVHVALKLANAEAGGDVRPHDYTAALGQAIRNSDEEMKSCEYEGTTATVVILWRSGSDRYIQAANLGDSTAFLRYCAV
jgi:serine/threonine protein phosphatase PrpC